jgi:acetylornithine aminotransferase
MHGTALTDSLAVLPRVLSVRGRGLLLGIEIDGAAAEVVEAAREQGLLVLTAGANVVRLAPPLTVAADEVDEALAILGRILC